MPGNRFRVAPQRRIVHELRAGSQAPQRHCANFVLCIGRAVLHDSIARANVVKQEIAEGMELLSSDRSRENVSAAVNGSARRSGRHGLNVTVRAADLFEDRLALIYLRGDGPSRRNF